MEKLNPNLFLLAASIVDGKEEECENYSCNAIARLVKGHYVHRCNESIFDWQDCPENDFFSAIFKPEELPANSSAHGWWGSCSWQRNTPPRVLALLLAYEIAKERNKNRRGPAL